MYSGDSGDEEKEDSEDEGNIDRDVYGPSVPKEELAEILKVSKRVDEQEPNLKLNTAMIDVYKKEVSGHFPLSAVNCCCCCSCLAAAHGAPRPRGT